MLQNQTYDRPVGFQQIVGLVAATALTVPEGAGKAVIVVETQGVRFRDDGANPTAAVGILLPAGTRYEYLGSLAAIRFIEVTPTATLSVAYYA